MPMLYQQFNHQLFKRKLVKKTQQLFVFVPDAPRIRILPRPIANGVPYQEGPNLIGPERAFSRLRTRRQGYANLNSGESEA